MVVTGYTFTHSVPSQTNICFAIPNLLDEKAERAISTYLGITEQIRVIE